jgi:hypothetical protein
LDPRVESLGDPIVAAIQGRSLQVHNDLTFARRRIWSLLAKQGLVDTGKHQGLHHCGSAKHLTPTDRLEGIWIMVDRRAFLVRWPRHSHNIKSGGTLEEGVLFQVSQGQSRQPSLLLLVDGLGWVARVVRTPCLDLHKNNRASINGNQVQLTQPMPIRPRDDRKTLSPKESCCGRFTPLPQGLGRPPTLQQLTYPAPQLQGNVPVQFD